MGKGGTTRHEQAARRLLARIAARRYHAPERMLPRRVPHVCEAEVAAKAPPSGCQINQRFHGRLRDRAPEWELMGASEDVLDMVQNGYKIDFGPPMVECEAKGCAAHATDNSLQCPRHRRGAPSERAAVPPAPFACHKNHAGAVVHSEWTERAVAELVKFGSVYECDAPPTAVLPLNVEPKATQGRFRLCHDLRHINACVRRCPFKMETLERMRGLLRRGRFGCSIDLSSSYYHLDICEEGTGGDSTRWLGFALDTVDNEGNTLTRYYRFCSLPFGLRSACSAFTLLMSTLVRHWRGAHGYELIGYLDDHAVFADTAEMVEAAARDMLSDLVRLGFVVNFEKSMLTASQCFKFLGIQLCLADGVFRVPQCRLEKLTALILQIVAKQSASPRELYKVAGQVCSMTQARGTRSCSTYTRSLYTECFDAASGIADWDRQSALSHAVLEELAFWYAMRDHDGCQPMSQAEFVADKYFYTDASDFAVGAHEDKERHRVVCRVDLPKFLRKASSAARELFGVDECVASLIGSGRIVAGDRVAIGTDAQCAAFGVLRGSSSKPVNHAMIKSILERAAAADVELAVFWIPREENQRADDISKIVDKHGFGIAGQEFERLSLAFGRHDVDGFASRRNTTCAAFVSRWPDARAEAVNAFHQDWEDGRRWWLFPPAPVVHRVVRKIACGGVVATLVVPIDPTADWWPILFPGGKPAPFVKATREVPATSIRRRGGNARHTTAARDATLLAIDVKRRRG